MRARHGQDPSDATAAVLAEQLRTLKPLSAAELPYAVVVHSADAGALATLLGRKPLVPQEPFR